ncbi:MAG: uncharacterized membrane-anchored protein YhcB (DUF1043 family) [Psychromonas sp.]|jgi:uncharacterized membrane-anchored protein YhcB (DUF1043 family)
MTEISGVLIFIIGGVIGGIIGFIISAITSGSKQKGLNKTKAELGKAQAELDNSKIELDYYKSQVRNHFSDSAKIMGQVASSYQALYTHMTGQSEALLEATEARVPFPQLETPPVKKQETAEGQPAAKKQEVEEEAPAAKQAPQSDTAKELRQIKAQEIHEIKVKNWMLQTE